MKIFAARTLESSETAIPNSNKGFRSYDSPMLGSNVYRYDTTSKILSLLTTFLARPNGVALLDDRENGNGCSLFLSDSGFETAPFDAEFIQSPRGLDGVGDSTIYLLKDPGNGCFSPKDGLASHQPVILNTKGIQDGMEVHKGADLLFFCDGSGLWVWSISLHQRIGLFNVGKCGQVMFPQKLGVQSVFVLQEQELREFSFHFEASNDSCTIQES